MANRGPADLGKSKYVASSVVTTLQDSTKAITIDTSHCQAIVRGMRIHALSGMGADERLFPAPWDTIPGFVAHSWAGCEDASSFREVAVRLCERYSIADGDSVIGTSMGGMVAVEIAKLRRISHLILVASAVSPDEVHPLMALLHPLVRVLPISLIQSVTPPFCGVIARMFREADARFLQSMCSALFRWEGQGALLSADTQRLRIHGRKDWVISRPQGVDVNLNGGHLLTLTHATDCVHLICHRLADGSSIQD